MKVNGIDARKYDAKQLTVGISPPSIAVNYEWLTGAKTPTEFETEVKMGHLKLTMYFKGEDRNTLIRTMSEFMANFTKSCVLELDGYKGKFKGYMTADNYEDTISKQRKKLNLEFDGYFYDDEVEITFENVMKGSFYMVGSRPAPCILEVTAKLTLTNYAISGFGSDDIIIEKLAVGKTIVIDATKGIVTLDGKNAFNVVDLWEFPTIKSGETALTFSNTYAVVKVRYNPMWI